MARNIIIIDRMVAIRSQVKSLLEAEFNDLVIYQAASLEEGAELLTGKVNPLVICSDRLPGIERIAFRPPALGNKVLIPAPTLLLLSVTSDPAKLERFRQQGFAHLLTTPVNAIKLAAEVERLLPARTLRSTPRYNIPDCVADLQLGDKSYRALLVNISLSGMLCELNLDAVHAGEFPGWPSATELATARAVLEFPAELGRREPVTLPCRLVGVMVLGWNPDSLPNRMRVRWEFLGDAVAAEEWAVLEGVLASREREFRG